MSSATEAAAGPGTDGMTHDSKTQTSGEILDWIVDQCRHIAATIDGLDETQLRAAVVQSGWSMLGLIGHVQDSTVFWLHNVILGDRMDFDAADDTWDNDPDLPGADVVDTFLRTVEAACDAARQVPISASPGWWPEGAWGGYRQDTVLGVLMHLFNDNGAHSGQLTIARELTDGGVWDLSAGHVITPAT